MKSADTDQTDQLAVEPRPIPRSSLLKVPAQRRSVAMIHKILDRATDLLAEVDSPLDFNTNRIAEYAGISTGSLYQYFANKEMIISGIVERAILSFQDVLRELMTAQLHAPLAPVLREAIDTMLTQLRPHRKVIREIFQTQPLLAETSVPAILETFLMDLVRDYLLTNQHRYRYEGGHAGIYVAVNSMVFLFLKWLIDPVVTISDDDFIDALVAQVTSPLVSLD